MNASELTNANSERTQGTKAANARREVLTRTQIGAPAQRVRSVRRPTALPSAFFGGSLVPGWSLLSAERRRQMRQANSANAADVVGERSANAVGHANERR